MFAKDVGGGVLVPKLGWVFIKYIFFIHPPLHDWNNSRELDAFLELGKFSGLISSWHMPLSPSY